MFLTHTVGRRTLLLIGVYSHKRTVLLKRLLLGDEFRLCPSATKNTKLVKLAQKPTFRTLKRFPFFLPSALTYLLTYLLSCLLTYNLDLWPFVTENHEGRECGTRHSAEDWWSRWVNLYTR